MNRGTRSKTGRTGSYGINRQTSQGAVNGGDGTQNSDGASSSPGDIQQRQLIAQQLIQNSLTPRQPELSWTQGAARMGQALTGALQLRKIREEQQQMQQQRGADSHIYGDMLLGKVSPGDAISSIQSPDIQAAIFQQMQKQNETKANQQFELDKQKSAVQNDPTKSSQMQLLQLENNRDALASKIAQIQDPNQKTQATALLDRINSTIDSYKGRLSDIKGDPVDIKKQLANQYLSNLNQANPQAAQAAAFKSGMPTPEGSLQKTIGEGIGKNINDEIASMNAEAQSSGSSRAQGEQVLQMLAANPNIQSGLGTEQMTKIKTALNTLSPGIFDNLSDQQVFQKGVGNLLLQNIGKLRTQGVQRITQNEIQNVIPMFTPTLLNSPQGIKKILELQNAMDPAIQKGNAALTALMQKYNADPNSIPNIMGAVNDIKDATRQEVQNATMNFMNASAGPSGQKIAINPDYDPVKNPVNKYIAMPAQGAPNMGQAPAPAVPAPQEMAPEAQQAPPQQADPQQMQQQQMMMQQAQAQRAQQMQVAALQQAQQQAQRMPPPPQAPQVPNPQAVPLQQPPNPQSVSDDLKKQQLIQALFNNQGQQ